MSGLFTFILILQTLVTLVMITVILMQRSEGGGFAGGGSPSGLMTARGAADFLTRTTAISAALFIALSIALAAVAAGARGPRTIDPSLLKTSAPPAGSPAEQQSSPFTINAQAVPDAPAAEANGSGVPIAQ